MKMGKKIRLVIFIICLLGINSCILLKSNWIINRKPSDEIFNPNLNMTKGSIIKYGYKAIVINDKSNDTTNPTWESGRYSKQVDDSNIILGCEPKGKTILFQEILKVGLAADSLKMINWIDENGGLICSDFIEK